jgi:outer membrane receptor for ferrienterochelin and colicin
VGFEATPGGLRFGGEFYHIDLTNALGTLNPSITSTYLTNPDKYTYNLTAAQYTAILATLGNGAVLGGQQPSSNIAIVVDTRISNLNAAIIEGVDFHLFYDTDTSFGRMSFGIAGTKQTKAAITNGGVLTNDLGKGGPELFVTSFIGWKQGPLSARLTINYSGMFHDAAVNSGGQVDVVSPFTVLNLNLGYTFGESAGPLEGTSLRLTIDNMFDEKPQTIRRVNTNNPSFNNWTLGRVIKLGATVKFRVTAPPPGA